MTLQDWAQSGWLVEHAAQPQEVLDLLDVADRDLADAQTAGLSADWRLNIAHNAALQSASAILAAFGYRASRESHHYRIIQSLVHTLGTDQRLISQLDQFRKKRNIGGYERAGLVSDQEAAEMLALARRLRQDVEDWLLANHPEWLAGR